MKACILLIEDNEDIRENAAELLELEGYKVVLATSGEEGLELVQIHLPDLVICDILMGGIDGYTVFQHIRADEKTRKIPFIFSSAKAERSDIIKANAMGINGYIVKPYNDVELFACVKKCLSS